MKTVNKILLTYKVLMPFLAFLIVAIMFPERVALLAAVGWISALLFVAVFSSRFMAKELTLKELLWEIMSILIIAASIILRENGSFETYFIEATLIDFTSLVIGLVIFQAFKMSAIDEEKSKPGMIVFIVLLIGFPIYYVTRCFILGWLELNTIHQDPTPFVLLMIAVLSNIVKEIRFFSTLLKGKAKYKMNFVEDNKWIIYIAIGVWAIIIPLLAWLIR